MSIETISVEELFRLNQSNSHAAFLVIDVRRTDFQDYFIPFAINLPAQSFLQTLPNLLPLLSQYERVIFHCSSSNGRGPRVAKYYQDALNEAGITHSRAVVLTGGIKAWYAMYGVEHVTLLEDKSEVKL